MKNFVILKCNKKDQTSSKLEYWKSYQYYINFLYKLKNFKLRAVELINEKYKDDPCYKNRTASNEPYLITTLLENYLNKLISFDNRISYEEQLQFEQMISVVEKGTTKIYFAPEKDFKDDEITAFWIIFFEDPNISTKINIKTDKQYFECEFFDPKEIKQNRIYQENNENLQKQLDIQSGTMYWTKLAMLSQAIFLCLTFLFGSDGIVNYFSFLILKNCFLTYFPFIFLSFITILNLFGIWKLVKK